MKTGIKIDAVNLLTLFYLVVQQSIMPKHVMHVIKAVIEH